MKDSKDYQENVNNNQIGIQNLQEIDNYTQVDAKINNQQIAKTNSLVYQIDAVEKYSSPLDQNLSRTLSDQQHHHLSLNRLVSHQNSTVIGGGGNGGTNTNLNSNSSQTLIPPSASGTQFISSQQSLDNKMQLLSPSKEQSDTENNGNVYNGESNTIEQHKPRLSKEQIAIKQQAKKDTVLFLRDVIQQQRRKTEYLESFQQLGTLKQQDKNLITTKKSETNLQQYQQQQQPIKIMINNKLEDEFQSNTHQPQGSPETDKSHGRKKSVRFTEDTLLPLQQQHFKLESPERLRFSFQKSNVQNKANEQQQDVTDHKLGEQTAKHSQQFATQNIFSSSINNSNQIRAKSFINTTANRKFSQSKIDAMHREMNRSHNRSEDKSQYTSSSEEENLPYPYNALPEQNWIELKQQLRKVNALLNQADKDNFSEKPLKRQVPLHSKIFAARLLSISQNRNNQQDPDQQMENNEEQNDLIQSQKIQQDMGFSEYSKKSFKQSSKKESQVTFKQQITRRKTIVDPYQCNRPLIQRKWRRLRNAILIVVRLLKIHQQILLYGTSEKLLDINRGISKVRDIMIPDSKLYKQVNYSKNQKTDIFMWIPESLATKCWQGVLILLLLYTATVMPYKIALIDDDENRFLFYLDTVIDFLFIFDMFINFNTPVEFKSEHFNFNRKYIALNYFKSWFIIDLIASLPMNLLQAYIIPKEYNLKGQDLIRIARLPRLYRLFRMARLIKIMKIFKSSAMFHKLMHFFKLNTSAVRLTTFFFTVFLCVHLTGCMWILAATLSDDISATWVYRKGLQDADDYSVYLAAIYWAFQTLLTVGYGDLSAFTNEEMIIAVLWMIIGSFFYTFTIGNLTSVISNQNTRQSQISDKVNIINQFCKETNLDRSLTNKLRNAIYYITKKNFVWADKIKIFEELPPIIKSEIAKEMHKGIIKKIRFFDDKDNNFIGSIVPLLTPLKTFRHEVIYKKENHPNAMFFITQGRVSFFIERKNIAFKDMIEGCYFGDIEIIFKRKRKFTVISAVDSDFLTLSKNIFEDIIQRDYPEIYEEMTIIAYEREKRIRDAKKMALVEYKAWKEKQEANQPYNLDDTEIIIDEADLYKLINDQEIEIIQEPGAQPLSQSPQTQDKQFVLKRELSRINESSEKDNSLSPRNSNSSQGKGGLSQPKKGILKKIKFVVKTDQNHDSKHSNVEVAFIQDQEPAENKLQLLTTPNYNDEESRYKKQQLDIKRESTMTLKSRLSNQAGAVLFGKQQTLNIKKIHSGIGNHLQIEKRNSIFDENRPSNRSNLLSPNINTIFKANQQLQYKTLNEDDEEIITKVRESKLQGRISKRNLDRIILKQQQREDDEDEDDIIMKNHKKLGKNSQLSIIMIGESSSSSSSNSSQSITSQSSTSQMTSQKSNNHSATKINQKKISKRIKKKNHKIQIISPTYSGDERNHIVVDKNKKDQQYIALEDTVIDQSSVSNSQSNSMRSGFASAKKSKKLKFNESIYTQKSSSKQLNQIQNDDQIQEQSQHELHHKIVDDQQLNKQVQQSNKNKYLQTRSETQHKIKLKFSGKLLNVQPLVKKSTINNIEDDNLEIQNQNDNIVKKDINQQLLKKNHFNINDGDIEEFYDNEMEEQEQKSLEKMRKNLQKDMDRLSNKLQKQALSQRSLEHKIDNIGDTLNTLIGQLVIIKENMQMEDDYNNINN